MTMDVLQWGFEGDCIVIRFVCTIFSSSGSCNVSRLNAQCKKIPMQKLEMGNPTLVKFGHLLTLLATAESY